MTSQRTPPEQTANDAIAFATRDIAETLDLRAIAAWTASGSTGLRIARERPRIPILALTPNVDAARRLSIVWGVHAMVIDDARDIDDMARRACATCAQEGFAGKGERIVVVAGLPFGSPGSTNTVHLAYV